MYTSLSLSIKITQLSDFEYNAIKYHIIKRVFYAMYDVKISKPHVTQETQSSKNNSVKRATLLYICISF